MSWGTWHLAAVTFLGGWILRDLLARRELDRMRREIRNVAVVGRLALEAVEEERAAMDAEREREKRACSE